MTSHSSSQQKRNAKRKFFQQDIPLTPMIDVVFQLLIYFVLTFEITDRMSVMRVWRPSPPPPGGAVIHDESMKITVYPGAVALNDTRVSMETLDKVLHRFADLNPTQNMIVIATGDSKHQELVDVLNLINKAGLEHVSLLSSE